MVSKEAFIDNLTWCGQTAFVGIITFTQPCYKGAPQVVVVILVYGQFFTINELMFSSSFCLLTHFFDPQCLIPVKWCP